MLKKSHIFTALLTLKPIKNGDKTTENLKLN